jgi:hypothetical protein
MVIFEKSLGISGGLVRLPFIRKISFIAHLLDWPDLLTTAGNEHASIYCCVFNGAVANENLLRAFEVSLSQDAGGNRHATPLSGEFTVGGASGVVASSFLTMQIICTSDDAAQPSLGTINFTVDVSFVKMPKRQMEELITARAFGNL